MTGESVLAVVAGAVGAVAYVLRSIAHQRDIEKLARSEVRARGLEHELAAAKFLCGEAERRAARAEGQLATYGIAARKGIRA